MPKPEKEKIVTELTENISAAKSILLTDFAGLNVEEISALRNQLRESSVQYKVVKNTLTRIAVERLGISQITNYLDGPTAIAIGTADPFAPIKIISEFIKKNNKSAIKAFYFDGQLYKGAEVDELAKLPGKEVLLAKLVGTIGAPLSNFVFVLKNVLQQLVTVVNEIKEKKEKAG